MNFFKQRTVANKLLVLMNLVIFIFLVIVVILAAFQLSENSRNSLEQKINSTLVTLKISTAQYIWSVDDIPLIAIRDKIKEDKDFVFINFYTEDSLPFVPKEAHVAPHIITADIMRENMIIGKVEIGYTDARVIKENKKIIAVLIILGVVVQFVLSFLTLYIIRKITSPISLLTEGVKRFGRGDFDVRIPVKGNDEIAELSLTFNQMTEELTKTMEAKNKVENDLREMNIFLEKKVEERTLELRRSQEVALKNAHAAGMAEISTQILHNIGNVTNSVNISVSTMRAHLQETKLKKLLQVNGILKENEQRLEDFLKNDPQAPLVASYVLGVGEQLKEENISLLNEMNELDKKLHLIKSIIHQQQDYAKGVSFFELVNLKETILEVLSMQESYFKKHHVSVELKYDEDIPQLSIQKTKFFHILINLLKNATEAMENTPQDQKQIYFEAKLSNDEVLVSVKDRGCGIEDHLLDQIFVHGFTTKPQGHGFGLHFCVNAIKEMGGDLKVKSEGPNKGATFFLILKTQN